MSGAGRKSGYRKSVTDAYEVGLPTPSSNEIIGKVKGCLGGNVFDIQFPQSSSSSSTTSSSSSSSTPTTTTTSTSVVLPSRFRKVIWVKRGDYVIVDTGNNKDSSKDNSKDNNDNDNNDDNNDINNNNNNDNCHYMIKHILNKDQIKHIKSIDLWPIEFDNDDGKKKDQGYGNDNDTMPGYQEQEAEEYYDDDDINEEDNSNNNNDNI